MACALVDISKVDKVKLLEALWHRQVPNKFCPGSFNAVDAKQEVESKYIDYFCSRCIKCDLSGDTVDPRLYDLDAGQGALKEVVDKMLSGVATKVSEPFKGPFMQADIKLVKL